MLFNQLRQTHMLLLLRLDFILIIFQIWFKICSFSPGSSKGSFKHDIHFFYINTNYFELLIDFSFDIFGFLSCSLNVINASLNLINHSDIRYLVNHFCFDVVLNLWVACLELYFEARVEFFQEDLIDSFLDHFFWHSTCEAKASIVAWILIVIYACRLFSFRWCLLCFTDIFLWYSGLLDLDRLYFFFSGGFILCLIVDWNSCLIHAFFHDALNLRMVVGRCLLHMRMILWGLPLWTCARAVTLVREHFCHQSLLLVCEALLHLQVSCISCVQVQDFLNFMFLSQNSRLGNIWDKHLFNHMELLLEYLHSRPALCRFHGIQLIMPL